jgi:hypothetical protein
MGRMGNQERIGYREEMSERRGLPWDPQNSHGKGNGSLSWTEMGMEITRREWEGIGIGQFPLEGKKNKLITHCSIIVFLLVL